MIDKLIGINPIKGLNKLNQTAPVKKADTSDVVQISDDAIAMNEIYEITQQVNAAPDVREHRIAQVMEAMKDPNYFSDDKLKIVAERMLNDLFV